MSNATSSDESFSYSYDSELEIDEVTTGYANEPEYEELKDLPPLTSSDDSDECSEVDLESSRLENLHWCKCKGHCSIQPSIVECK